MLARKGHEVVLFEKERFPREHIGESLLPASVPVLEALGVRDAVERAGFLKTVPGLSSIRKLRRRLPQKLPR